MRSSTPPAHRPRLLLVTHHYAPEHGAPQRRWDALVPRLISAGVDVSVLTPPPHYPAGRVTTDAPEHRRGASARGRHGEYVVRTGFREHGPDLLSRSVDQLVAAASAVRLGLRHFAAPAQRPDLVVGTVPGIPSMFAAWLLARLLGARFVVEMRDAWPDLIAPAGVLRARGARRHRVVDAVRASVHRTVSRWQQRADAVVTTTEAFAAVLRERGVRHVAVVRNGTSYAPDPAPHPGGSPHRAISGRPLRAVYAGTVGRAQDLGVVVRASARLAREGVAVDLRIVGAGVEVGPLQELARELGAPVTFGGVVPHEEVRELYRWADTVVVSLRDWVPLEWTVPSKLYEVMASGRFVTACVAGESATLVTATGAGAVAPPGDVDALVALWSGWAAAGRVPGADPGAARWIARHAHDDVIGRHWARLVEHVVAAPARLATSAPVAADDSCGACARLGATSPSPALPRGTAPGSRPW